MRKSVSERRPRWVSLAGLGVELGGAVLGLTLLGYWIDRHYGTAPKGVLIGAVLGLIGGMYNFIRSSLLAARSAAGKDEERDGDQKGEGG